MEKWSSILDKNVSDTPMSVLIESQQKELISDTESRDENNRRMIETYHSLLNNELKQFDESKQYLEFKCSNDQCDVCNYSSHFSLAICSLRYRPNSGCFKCGSKINVYIKTNHCQNMYQIQMQNIIEESSSSKNRCDFSKSVF